MCVQHGLTGREFHLGRFHVIASHTLMFCNEASKPFDSTDITKVEMAPSSYRLTHLATDPEGLRSHGS